MAATINASTSSGIVTSADNSGQLELQTANTTRLTIDSSGNVGIGTTSPGYKLDVQSSSSLASFQSSGSGNGNIKLACTNVSTAGVGYIGMNAYVNNLFGVGTDSSAAVPVAFFTQGTERMRIDTSGNVGIGTSSPIGKFDVGGASTAASNTTAYIHGTDNASYGQALAFRRNGSNSFVIGDSGNILGSGGGATILYTYGANHQAYYTNGSERMRIDSSGNVGIGVTPGGTGLLELAAGTTTVAPLEFTSGTNLTTPVAGAVEYDGTIMTATSNTNFKRGTIPLTNYTSGTGITLGTNTEATLQRLLPAANDTITLSVGTYFFDTQFIVTRGASTTSATTRLNILGAGTAAGTFSAMGFSFINISGSPSGFAFNAVNINVTNVVSAASTTSGGLYYVQLRGILKITSSGTIIPQYNLSVNINGAGTVSNVWYFTLQQLDTQSAAAFGPAGTGWA